ncbi:hypothetical protein FACS189483_02330 [Spirochaetia bacterium]|nr:hypothetical protein FACS189483_02330 [Spirochaetia bacterium]
MIQLSPQFQNAANFTGAIPQSPNLGFPEINRIENGYTPNDFAKMLDGLKSVPQENRVPEANRESQSPGENPYSLQSQPSPVNGGTPPEQRAETNPPIEAKTETGSGERPGKVAVGEGELAAGKKPGRKTGRDQSVSPEGEQKKTSDFENVLAAAGLNPAERAENVTGAEAVSGDMDFLAASTSGEEAAELAGSETADAELTNAELVATSADTEIPETGADAVANAMANAEADTDAAAAIAADGLETPAQAENPEGSGSGGDRFAKTLSPASGDTSTEKSAMANAGVNAASRSEAAEAARVSGAARQRAAGSLNAEQDGDSRTGTTEKRGRDKRRDRLTLEVHDQRTAARTERESVTAIHAGTGRETDGGSNHSRETDITVELRSQARSQVEARADGDNRPTQGFQDMLARELHENVNGDIVRHASVMLRDGGEGTIRLSLKPESLGNVKIRLEMTDNKIAGQIIVESDEALRAFEQEIRALEQAFRDSGFEGASLEMAVAADGGQNGAGGQGKEGEASPFFSERMAASVYDAASYEDLTEAGNIWFTGGSSGEAQVNMLV